MIGDFNSFPAFHLGYIWKDISWFSNPTESLRILGNVFSKKKKSYGFTLFFTPSSGLSEFPTISTIKDRFFWLVALRCQDVSAFLVWSCIDKVLPHTLNRCFCFFLGDGTIQTLHSRFLLSQVICSYIYLYFSMIPDKSLFLLCFV